MTRIGGFDYMIYLTKDISKIATSSIKDDDTPMKINIIY